MSSVSLGDLSQTFFMQRRTVELRQQLGQLTDELSSGRVSDIKEVLAGNHNYLTSLERSLTVLEGYSVANGEAAYLTGAMQASLDRVQGLSGELGIDLLLASGGPVGVVSGNPSENARVQLGSILNSLNGNIAGRSLFAGAATDQTPLESSEVILNELRTALAGQTTPDELFTAAESWFSDPAGFDAVIYQGSASTLAPFVLSDTEMISLDVRANDTAIKNAIMNVALAALADDPGFGLSVPQQSELFGLTGAALQSNQDQLTSLRSSIGFTEARIEQISVRNQSEATSFEFARNQLLEADPFETATQLEAVQFRLQSIYSVTVRSSQLSLVNFL